jgi:hypothetical protein
MDEEARDEEHAEDVVAARLELGPRLVLVLRRGEQLLERAVVHGGRELLAERIGARVEEIDPARMPRAHPGEASASVG